MGIHWYHCNPTFLWKFKFTLVRRLISALIWDISGLWNRSDGRDFREKRIVISRFLTPYMLLLYNSYLSKLAKRKSLMIPGFGDLRLSRRDRWIFALKIPAHWLSSRLHCMSSLTKLRQYVSQCFALGIFVHIEAEVIKNSW